MSLSGATGRCESVCPIMPTTDVPRTVKFYESLGFSVEVRGDFVMTKRDHVELFLSLNMEHDPKRTAACVFIRVDDANALHEHWQATFAGDVKPLRDTDYGMREFAIIDPDGNNDALRVTSFGQSMRVIYFLVDAGGLSVAGNSGRSPATGSDGILLSDMICPYFAISSLR